MCIMLGHEVYGCVWLQGGGADALSRTSKEPGVCEAGVLWVWVCVVVGGRGWVLRSWCDVARTCVS